METVKLDLDLALHQIKKFSQNKNKQYKPFMIIAPTARCGTTLLQRLVSSAKGTIIYGENKDIFETYPTTIYSAAYKVLEKEGYQDRLTRFLAGSQFWSPDIIPETEQYLDISIGNFFNLLKHYKTFSKQQKRSFWGLKHPSSVNLPILQMLLPNAKFIFLCRNLLDIAKSYKSKQWLKTDQQVTTLALNWSENVNNVMLKKADNVLFLKYETLLAESDQSVQAIESFLGISDINLSIMDTKVNTFQGSNALGFSSTEYIAPQMLTPQEQRLLVEHAGDTLKKLGYTSTQ